MAQEVFVDPDGAPLAANPNSSGLTATFQVYTTSLWDETVQLSCGRTGQVTSCSVASSVVVPGNGEGPLEVQVTYATGSAGTGTLVLYATWAGWDDDQGSYNVTVSPPPPTITVVTPGNTVYTRTPLVLVKYTNGYGTVDTSSLVVTWGGTNVKALGRYNDRLFEWEVDGSANELTPGGTKQLYVYVCSTSGPCSSATRNVTLASSPRPILSLKPMPLEAQGRQFSAPLGPGIGVSGGGDIQMGISTPAYYSFNSPRTAGLTFSSRQAYPRALVNVDLEFPGSVPSSLTMRLKDGGATVDSAVFSSPNCSTGGAAKCRIALEAAFLGASYYPAVRKWLRVEAQATIGGTPYTVYDSVEVVLVDRRTTPYGSGWWPSGVMRLVSSGDDAVLVASDGNATVFRGAGSGAAYLAAPGQTSTLVKVGSTWELRFRGGGKVTFDPQGRQTTIVDINGNVDSITYNTTDQVNRIKDPKGKYFTFTYGNPNSTVSAITDPGSRQTTITVNASRQVTAYTVDPGTGHLNYGSSFTWSGYTGSAVLPRTRVNEVGAVDSIRYTAALRPYQVKLRTVPNEYGSNVNPTIQYYPQELKGLHVLKPLNQLYTEVIDAKGNWARTELNRWGDAARTWDTIGTVTRATYDAAGRVVTAEGKMGDSTRLFYLYDGFGRLVRTRRVKRGGGTLRVDSIVYDPYHRPIKHLDAQNRVTETVYDAVGNPIRVIAPNGATSYTWYGAYGQVDSTRAPTASAADRYIYESTWRNTWKVYGPGSELRALNTYDTFGRLQETQSRITVQVTANDSKLQWRRRKPFYNAANQVDSAYAQRTNNCSAPCNGPPAWPATSDTLRSVTTRTVFTRLGSDSIRTIGTGLPEVFAYDALGRVLRHWPRGRTILSGMTATDTTPLTYRYDIGGNLRYTVTRRGHTLESQFDTRNRLTRRVLGATVGTFDYAYNGPNDELTAVTAQSGYADSVGSSTIRAAWVYNPYGQLIRDTTQGSRVTAYFYSDSLMRLDSLQDAIGTRKVRYDAATGAVDSISDPTDGWVRYWYGSDGHVMGPWIDGTGTDFSRTQDWPSNKGLVDLTNYHGYTVGHWYRPSDEGPDTLGTIWEERHGSGGSLFEMPDSAIYDGWGRLTALTQRTSHYVAAAEIFDFDARGNITIDSSGATFNRMDQLTGTTTKCHTMSYDAAGNLTSQICGAVTLTYTYDALDRLTNVSGAGLTAAYTYDVLGNRIAKKVDTTITRFVWRSGHVIYETNSGGTITYSYQWGLETDDLLAIHDHASNAHYYVVQDRLRTVRGLVNRNGSWVGSWRYRAYGEPLDSAGSASAGLKRFRWAGAQYDAETGFYFLRTRYYDPSVGRFVQEDKIGRAGGANLYAYAGGNPVASRDPGGTTKNYDLQYDWNKPAGGGGAWGDWKCIADPWTGCTWMPPGLSDGAASMFTQGVAASAAQALAIGYQDYLGKAESRVKKYGVGGIGVQPLSEGQWTYLRAAAVLGISYGYDGGKTQGEALYTLGAGAWLLDSWSLWTRGEGIVPGGPTNPATTVPLRPGDAWSLTAMVNSRLFTMDFGVVANVVVHESQHLLSRGYGSDQAHCAVYYTAWQATGTLVSPPAQMGCGF